MKNENQEVIKTPQTPQTPQTPPTVEEFNIELYCT